MIAYTKIFFFSWFVSKRIGTYLSHITQSIVKLELPIFSQISNQRTRYTLQIFPLLTCNFLFNVWQSWRWFIAWRIWERDGRTKYFLVVRKFSAYIGTYIACACACDVDVCMALYVYSSYSVRQFLEFYFCKIITGKKL